MLGKTHILGCLVRAAMPHSPESSPAEPRMSFPSVAAVFLLLALLPMVVVPSEATCAETDRRGSVVLLLVNWLSLDDLIDSGENVRSLINDGSVGLMNTGRYRQDANEIRFLVLGAGRHVSGSGGAAKCYASSELVNGCKAGEVYLRQTGRRPPENGVVCLGLSRILPVDSPGGLRLVSVGLLGDSARADSMKTVFIGGGEPSEAQLRWGGFAAMDRDGVIDSGNFGSDVVKADPHRPYGVADDIAAMASLVGEHLASRSLIVVQPSDLSRCESARMEVTEAAYQLYRSLALRDLDALVGRLRPHVERAGAALIICSPARVRPTAGYASNLAPVVCLGPGCERGLLTSGTTLTPGLIANIDVALTVLGLAGLPLPDGASGCPARVMHSSAKVEVLRRMEHVAARNYAARGPVLAGVAVVVILAATLSEVLLMAGASRMPSLKFLRLALLFLISLPAAFLLVDGIGFSGLGWYLPALISAALSWVVVAHLIASLPRSERLSPPGVLLTMTALLVSVDVLTGEHLLRWSILTCNQVVGIRYYGLGNEYMGVLIGAGLIGPMLLFDRPGREPTLHWSKKNDRALLFAFAAWFLFLAFVIGYPALGSNVGGFATAVAAFGIALVLLTGSSVRITQIAGLIAFAALAIALFAVLDARSSSSSHLGRALSLAEVSGAQYLLGLVSRKLEMHIGILRLPQTYYAVLCSIPFLLMFRGRVVSEGARGFERFGLLHRVAIPAVITGSAVGFLINDSGIVPAGMLICMLLLTLLSLRLNEVDA